MNFFKKLVEITLNRKILRYGKDHCIFINENSIDELWFLYAQVLSRYLKKYNINLVLDVGANEGQFGSFLRNEVKYSGKIISFEPTSKAFSILSQCTKNDPMWEVHNFALGKENKKLPINVSKMTVFSSFLKSNSFNHNHFGDISNVEQTETVTVKTLNDFFKDNQLDTDSTRAFLKMDTQGFDLEVFKGSSEILQRITLLQSEVSLIPIYENSAHWTENILEFEKSDYGVVGLYPVNFSNDRIMEYDCLMIKNQTIKP